MKSNRARYYDPGTGRFLSEDHKGYFGGETNSFRYTRNNPMKYIDSNGKSAKLICYAFDLAYEVFMASSQMVALQGQINAYQSSISDMDMQIANWTMELNAPRCKDTAYIQARLASLKISRDESVNKLNLLIAQQGNLIAMAMLEGGALAGLCKSLPI